MIPRCEQKRNQSPGKGIGKCKIQQHQNEIANSNYNARHDFPPGSTLAETTTKYHQQNLNVQRNQPIRNNLHKL